jgi:hypothetical protein
MMHWLFLEEEFVFHAIIAKREIGTFLKIRVETLVCNF